MKLAAPTSVFSRSTEGHNQDKVLMGPIAARDLRAIGELVDHLHAIGLLAATQATDATGRAAELPAPPSCPPRSPPSTPRSAPDAPATVEDDRHDQRITRCLALYRAGQLPI